MIYAILTHIIILIMPDQISVHINDFHIKKLGKDLMILLIHLNLFSINVGFQLLVDQFQTMIAGIEVTSILTSSISRFLASFSL